MAFNRNPVTSTGMTGTPASPTTIAGGASNTGTFVLDTANSGGKIARADVAVAVIIGSSAPGTNPVVTFSYTFDGTHFIPDGQGISVPLTTSTANYYGYRPPVGALGASVTVANGTTNAITAWAQCETTSIG